MPWNGSEKTWEQFDRNTRRVMVRDTIEALMDDRAGGLIDVDGWQGFAAFGYLRLNERSPEMGPVSSRLQETNRGRWGMNRNAS